VTAHRIGLGLRTAGSGYQGVVDPLDDRTGSSEISSTAPGSSSALGSSGRAGGRITLEPVASSAATARQFVAGQLAGWDDDAIGDARLLVTELVTNAVVHAATEVEVAVQRHDRRARVEVFDSSPATAAPKSSRRDEPTGRGLVIVAGLSSDWGVRHLEDSKVVWFEVESP
jgi:anti-sigma regulatory factor (Ser/Thr protein kinase)